MQSYGRTYTVKRELRKKDEKIRFMKGKSAIERWRVLDGMLEEGLKGGIHVRLSLIFFKVPFIYGYKLVFLNTVFTIWRY